MKRYLYFLVSFVLVLFLSRCGKKGPIQPPLPKIPQDVEILGMTQKGNNLVLRWVNPTAYLDGSPILEISQVEIWLLALRTQPKEQRGAVDSREYEKRTRRIAYIKREKFSEHRIPRSEAPPEFRYFYRLEAQDFDAKEFIFSIRIRDGKNRKSGFSDYLAISPMVLSLPPENPRAVGFKGRIEISWDSPQGNLDGSSPPVLKGYNIYRVEGEEEPLRINSSLILGKKYEDPDFIFGRTYRYYIRASASDFSSDFESDDSDVVEFLAEDTFPPSPPTGLMSVVGENVIALSWDANLEEDFAGYRVWKKAEGEEEYTLLTPYPFRENAYSDSAVEKNKRYFYAITAQDKNGNESKKSESLSEIIREGAQ